MEELLDKNFNPNHYLPEVVTKVASTDINHLEQGQMMIRMIIELRAKNLSVLESIIAKILQDPPQGYEMYQVMTARLIVAYWKNDKTEFLRLADLWLDGRRSWRSNWNSDVLEIKEFKPWLSEMDSKLFELKPSAAPEITAEDRAFIKDEKGFLLAALKENLAHFRAIGIKDSIAKLARKYRVFAVNRHLGEITFEADDDLPGLIVALDTDGNFSGSFISH